MTHCFILLMLPAFTATKESEGGELTAFKTLHELIRYAGSKCLFLELYH